MFLLPSLFGFSIVLLYCTESVTFFLNGFQPIFKKKKKKREAGLINGFLIEDFEIMITHLQFVDDALIFLNVDHAQAVNLKIVLQWFELVIGLKIKSCEVKSLESWWFIIK